MSPKSPNVVPLVTQSRLPNDLLEFEAQMEWDIPELRMAQSRLVTAAQRLNISEDILRKLMFPKRAIVSSVPVRMDDGKLTVFAGYLVNHSETLGPCHGQLRYQAQLSLGEITALAMSHTWRSALVNLPLGGAQGGVRCDPDELSKGEVERITRRYTAEMVPMLGPEKNILSPGLGTNENTMAWMMDTFSLMKGQAVREVVTGKPRIIGGSLGRREAPGRSVVYCIIEAAEILGMPLDGNTRVVIQGFGKLARAAFKKLHRMGCKIIAVNDVRGGVYNKNGLDYKPLVKFAEETDGFVGGYPEGEAIDNEELLALDCDILLPAAVPHQISGKNADRIKVKIIAEGANEVSSLEADQILLDRGIFIIPDILATAGGTVVSYFEWVQGLQSFFWNEREVYHRLYQIIKETFHRVYEISKREQVDMRLAALMAGVGKVATAMAARGLYP